MRCVYAVVDVLSVLTHGSGIPYTLCTQAHADMLGFPIGVGLDDLLAKACLVYEKPQKQNLASGDVNLHVFVLGDPWHEPGYMTKLSFV